MDFSVRCPVLGVGFGTRSVVAFVLFVFADLVFVGALGPAGAAVFVVLAGVDAVVLALVLAGALGPLGVRALLAGVMLAGVDAVVLALVLAGARGPLGVHPLPADGRAAQSAVVVVDPSEISRPVLRRVAVVSSTLGFPSSSHKTVCTSFLPGKRTHSAVVLDLAGTAV